jgi:hypothetical protein
MPKENKKDNNKNKIQPETEGESSTRRGESTAINNNLELEQPKNYLTSILNKELENKSKEIIQLHGVFNEIQHEKNKVDAILFE